MFMQLTGTTMTHIPYKGTSPALVDLVGGNVDVFFDNISSSAQFHTGNKLHMLAVADDKRSPLLPQVPTLMESKVPMEAVTFFSVVAPPGTPPAIAAAMQKAIAGVLALPDVKQRFAEQGAVPRGWSPEETGAFIRNESDKWNKVIQSANVKLG
jgi:tripartite-type tricarboxylate transporter receptor subunit TctC